MAGTPKRPLGRTQLAVLRALQDERHGGVWYAGCGWIWSNVSETTRIMDGLVNRGLVTRTSEPVAFRGDGSVLRTQDRYDITDAGRAVDVAAQERERSA